MKCENHPGANAIAQCTKCAIPLCGVSADFSKDDVFCEKCVKDSEISAFVESQAKPRDEFQKILNEPEPEIQAPKTQKLEAAIERREKMHMAIVILGCVFIGFRLFTDIGSRQILTAQQIREEETAIEQRTLCVQVFWEIAAVLQNGEEPDSTLRCQETPALNIVSRTDSDIVISHPNPSVLGFSELYVSRSNPIPTATVL